MAQSTIDKLSAVLHEIYQLEAHRRGDVRHADNYDDLSEDTKEWDRVLARWILKYWIPVARVPAIQVDYIPQAELIKDD
jgi:hypothetical protein